MRMSRRALAALPTTRLYFDPSDPTKFAIVPYMNAQKSLTLPLTKMDFKPNGQGLPWACGISNAVMSHQQLFDHDVIYAHTIGSVLYIVAMVHKGGAPKLAVRYRHHGGPLVGAYDESRKSKRKMQAFLAVLDDHPYLVLEKGRSEAGKGAHSPGAVSGHKELGAPRGDQNKKGLVGARRRAERAGLIPSTGAT